MAKRKTNTETDVQAEDKVTEPVVADDTDTPVKPVDEPVVAPVEKVEPTKAESVVEKKAEKRADNVIKVFNNASRNLYEPATATLLKSGEITDIFITVEKQRIINNINQLNYLHGNCLVIQ